MAQKTIPSNGTTAKSRWETPCADFTYLLFERVEPAENANRYYYLGWMPTLLHSNAVVRFFGRKGETQRMIQPQPFDTLDEAWPLIRSIIRARLRHGYRIVQPREYVGLNINNFDSSASEAMLQKLHDEASNIVAVQLELIPLDAIGY